MKILGIESSCDETAASVVELHENGVFELHSNVIASSIDLHVVYGGVVPEIAARSHIEHIMPVINQALSDYKNGQISGLDEVQGNKENRENRTNGTVNESRTKLTQQFPKNTGGTFGSAERQASVTDDLWDEIDAIAVTYGPGLGGSLLVGSVTARTLAIIKNKPLYAVNHVMAHPFATFITKSSLTALKLPENAPQAVQGRTLETAPGPTQYIYRLPKKAPQFPMLALIVSGGHSQLVIFDSPFEYKLLGRTRDDAVGEAFDKIAKILGLSYPGGPSVAKKATFGDPNTFKFPKSRLENPYDFSFSGLKTAVLRTAQGLIGKDHTFPSSQLASVLSEQQKADISASFQKIALETLVDQTYLAYKEFNPKSVVVAGGVAANKELRIQLSERLPITPIYTDMKLCTDNGAMIAVMGCIMKRENLATADPYTLDISPDLSM